MTNSERGRELVFVTGGARSGKSRFAQETAEAWPGRLLYIATARAGDSEMAERVAQHRKDRGARWDTLEEPLDLVAALAAARGYGGALLDCLTLWTANVMERTGGGEEAFRRESRAFLQALMGFGGRVCVVSNEVGSGIVPANALARGFRDLAGRLNQEVAAVSTAAFLVVSGLPLRLK